MTPLFDLASLARRDDGRADTARPGDTKAGKALEGAPIAAPVPVEYTVRGVFRSGDNERTHTVQAVGMSSQLDADATRFVVYLRREGFQFPEGRATLITLLAVSGADGTPITLNHPEEDSAR